MLAERIQGGAVWFVYALFLGVAPAYGQSRQTASICSTARHEPTAKDKASGFSTSELEAVLQLSPAHGQIDVRNWRARRNVYLVGVVNEAGDLELFAVSSGADKRPFLLARAAHPVNLAGGYSYEFDLAP